MALLCQRCGNIIPDIGQHLCWANGYVVAPQIVYSPPLQPLRTPVKCDLCGSTAIDHTEQQCQLNRTLRLSQRLNHRPKSQDKGTQASSGPPSKENNYMPVDTDRQTFLDGETAVTDIRKEES